HTFVLRDPAELVGTIRWLDGEPDGAEPMVIEEYLPSRPGAERCRFADYVSVETLAVGGRLHHVAVTGRLHQAPSLRETGYFIPSDLGAGEQAAVVSVATHALDALGVRDGCAHTEVKLTPDGPRVIEVNGRLGGGVADMLAMAAGVDLLALCLRAALGEPVNVASPAPCARVGFRLFLQPPPSARRVLAIDGLDALATLPGVATVAVHLAPGDPVDPRQGTRAFVLAVVGTAGSPEEVAAVDRRMYEVAGVTYEHQDEQEHGHEGGTVRWSGGVAAEPAEAVA
ncbi:MAG: ATP-grasp domain-containing protein, partial [Acidimicrobiales bacterium]